MKGIDMRKVVEAVMKKSLSAIVEEEINQITLEVEKDLEKLRMTPDRNL